jgi:hypothetical protein
MNPDTFRSAQGRPIDADGHPDEANAPSSASRDSLHHQDEQNGDVVRVTAADVLTSLQLHPPTAQTFEELGIPAAFREAVEKELTRDEKMVWVGRPSQNPEVQSRPRFLLWAGSGLLVLAGVLFVAILGAGGPIFFLLFAGVLGLLGLIFLLPWFLNTANSCRCCYVVTNRRALIVELSMWKRGAAAFSYLPQQLLGMDRRDHETVADAGDLVFEYTFALPGNSFNIKTGTLFQGTAGAGMGSDPQRVARGFMGLDQVRDVEDLIRSTLLAQLEQSLETSAAANRDSRSTPAIAVACPCGVTLAAPSALAGKSVKCPRCAAAVALPAPADNAAAAFDPISCREDGEVPADLKDKLLKGLNANEKPVWIGQPVPNLVLLRSSGYFVVGGIGILIAVIWLYVLLTPAKAPPPPKQGKPVVAAPAAQSTGNLWMLPATIFLVSACFSAVPVLRWRTAKRTCYVLTNRRALVYKESLFSPTRESYPPLEVSNMRRSDSWLASGSGDLIYRTVYVVSTSRSRSGGFSSSVRTVHYGFLAIAQVAEVEKIVRETLIDPVVDKLTGASALR